MKKQVLIALAIGFGVGIVPTLTGARLNNNLLSEVEAGLAAQQQSEFLRSAIKRESTGLSSSVNDHATAGGARQVSGDRKAANAEQRAARVTRLKHMELSLGENEELAKLYLGSAIAGLQIMVSYRPYLIFIVLAGSVSIMVLVFLQQQEQAAALANSAKLLRSQNDKLETIMQQRERFIATLAHDMKVPLVGAELVFASMMDKRPELKADEQAELLKKLRKNNAEVLSKLQDMIQIYRYENPELSEPDTVITMDGLLRRCVEWISPIAKLQGVTVKFESQDDSHTCRIDVRGIERLVLSLLDNAIKFSPQNSIVTLSTVSENGLLQIKISDHGKGIAPEDQARLFSGHSTRDSANTYAGNGLGLYLAKLVVEAHGGTIDCKSEVGVGSAFTVHLPLA